MLFHSPEFILFFLPTVLALFYACRQFGSKKISLIVLILASLFFYGWWNPAYLSVILSSVVANFRFAELIGAGSTRLWRKRFLILGIFANLCLLGYFKYAGFFSAASVGYCKPGGA